MLSPLIRLLGLSLSWPFCARAMRPDRLETLRKATVDMFYHGFDNYMEHAFPEDELRPVSCTPLTRDRHNDLHYGINDVLGNYSLTLIDSLSTLAILASSPANDTAARALADFQNGIAQFVKYYGDGRPGPSGEGLRARGFDLDSKVQVFETVIRGVGGLLSAHLFAIGELPITGYHPGRFAGRPVRDDPLELYPVAWPNGFKYDGQLLRLTLDLAQRLLPAFYTKTGLPYPRVNLRHGVPFYSNSPLNEPSSSETTSSDGPPERTETCSAGAGSLVLEFTTLSRLTGDARFEQLGKRAFWEVWERRSDIGLVGNRIDPEGGHWLDFDTGIGAGIDSFFEYALKSHILLSGQALPNMTMPEARPGRPWLDPNSLYPPLSAQQNSPDAFLQAWHKAHAAVKRHLYEEVHHPHYVTGHLRTGSPVAMWIDSLGAFYPGLLALAGELEEAIASNLLYTALWTRYAALPERWNYRDSSVFAGIGWWPGRPEFIESTYHIYRATKDPWYLYVGEMVLHDIARRCYTECGWSGLQDVRTGEKMDRMESFFLGETTKYMYLLFDPDHPLNKLDAAYVFTTEGHPLLIPRKRTIKGHPTEDKRRTEIAVYFDESYTNSCPVAPGPIPLSISATASRPDVFHASSFTGLHTTPNIHGEIEIIGTERTDKGEKPKYRAKSNYTFFPWTLPMEMLPENGVCATLPGRQTLTIEFPSNMQQGGSSGGSSAFNSIFGGGTVTRVSHQGVYVHSLSGLRLMLALEDAAESDFDTTWRVTSVNSIALGRDEQVYIDAGLVGAMSDPLFNRVRDPTHVDIVFAYDDRRDEGQDQLTEGVELGFEDGIDLANTTMNTEDATVLLLGEDGSIIALDNLSAQMEQLISEAAAAEIEPQPDPQTKSGDYKSLLKSLVRAVTGVFEPSSTSAASNKQTSSENGPLTHAESYGAALPVGKGAVLLPDVPDAPSASTITTAQQESALTPEALASHLPWTTIYLAGMACDARLPDEAPRTHQVIVMRRGGCSFSEKLANIPSFPPSAQSLQLVVVVDEEGDDEEAEIRGLIRPRLDDEQLTPTGMRRPHPIAMVMIHGQDAYEKFKTALAVGVRRRYFIEVQGLRAQNIQIL